MAGEDLMRFLSRAEIRRSLPIELQAEITFGLEQSQAPSDELLLLTESALAQDDIWREDAEPELAKLRREATRTSPPTVADLSASAPREMWAWTLAWQQDWEAAAQAAVEVLEHLTASELRPYRALWAYLGNASVAAASAVLAEDLLAALSQ